jgi:hypothetical protein
MAQPLMPKATAVWLLDNTTLTFRQVGLFCGLHELEVQAIADGEVAIGMVGVDPVANGQLAKSEIERCEADPTATLVGLVSTLPAPASRTKGPRYTPVSKRGEKPDAIAWILKNIPQFSDQQICKLIGTTKPTILAVRNRTHENSATIKPRNPVSLGFCTQTEMDDLMRKMNISPAEVYASSEPEPSEMELSYESFKL